MDQLGARHLDWEGCFNARDLGGIPTADGHVTRPGAVVRSDSLDRLTPAGFRSLLDHGIRTIVDLRNDDERSARPGPTSPELSTLHVPLDDTDDVGFWRYCWDNELDGSPLYFRPFLERKPERCVAAVAAVAHAPPGGVVVHCGAGRDRTGLITLLLLSLVGATPEDIARDYELSTERLSSRYAALGEDDQGPMIRDILTRKHTSATREILSLLDTLDVESHLRSAGLRPETLDALRSRLRSLP